MDGTPSSPFLYWQRRKKRVESSSITVFIVAFCASFLHLFRIAFVLFLFKNVLRPGAFSCTRPCCISRLLHRYRFRQIPRLINITAPHQCHPSGSAAGGPLLFHCSGGVNPPCAKVLLLTKRLCAPLGANLFTPPSPISPDSAAYQYHSPASMLHSRQTAAGAPRPGRAAAADGSPGW